MGTVLNATVNSTNAKQPLNIPKKEVIEIEVKNDSSDKKSKKDQKSQSVTLRVSLPYKPKGEMFAVAETFQGGSRLQVICEDGIRRMGRIPGKLRRRMWVVP